MTLHQGPGEEEDLPKPVGTLALQVVALPGDTNADGDI